MICAVLVALLAHACCASRRAVENLTDATLALTPPLMPSTRWQLPSDDWFEQRDAAQRNVARRNTLWRLSSRLFQRVFSLSRSGNQLAGQPRDPTLHAPGITMQMCRPVLQYLLPEDAALEAGRRGAAVAVPCRQMQCWRSAMHVGNQKPSQDPIPMVFSLA